MGKGYFMFDSGVSLKDTINEFKNEVDIALDIPDTSYVEWENSLEQLLYSELILEQREIIIDNPTVSFIDISTITVPHTENIVRFEDIHTVYADDTQLIKSNLASGAILPNVYYKQNNGIGYSVQSEPANLRIIYIARPALKTVDDMGNIMLPVEFVELSKAKLRGEAYKLANEDALAGKWMNDYNILLETFKAWLSSRAGHFGL